ncbi:aminotransferase class III-fold pyridoxal phosphate-dependent enzyme [Halovenus halobia]|uniref:aminotransferase class III-fold pyridoxal phosphate-dependent enzyme n=1 Tax=Halovenus halobia TaxID=3396622 RepID=UPI003F549079
MQRESAEPEVSELPGDRGRRVVDFHHEHAAPSTYVYEFVWDHEAPAVGPFCTDVDGNVLMDFTSHVGANPLGYNNPKVLDRFDEFDLVDPLKIAGQDFYLPASSVLDDAGIPGPADLMAKLTDISDHYGMETVFLSNSGAEAVENALKVSYDHTDGKYAITCEGAFHGRTLGTLSLNRSKEVYRRKFPEIASVQDIPYCTDRACNPESCDCGFFFDETSSLRQMVGKGGYVNPDEVAALVMEPIQGEGGYRFPSASFAEEIAAVTDEYDIPLVVDEVQAGLGRTGEWWGSDHYALEPDVIASAKAARVGATIGRTEMFPEETSRLSSTWGAGDIVSSAQAVFTIDAIEDNDLLANATARGRQMKERLRDENLSGVVDVRGKGLMLAVEFESKELRDAVQQEAFSRGFLILGCGERTMRLLPPLDVTEREIDLGADLFAESVRAV